MLAAVFIVAHSSKQRYMILTVSIPRDSVLCSTRSFLLLFGKDLLRPPFKHRCSQNGGSLEKAS